MTNSGKADAQDEQIAAHQDANFTQGKAADTTVDPVKPSEPFRAFSHLCWQAKGYSYPFLLNATNEISA
jgi:hypothetical protein